MGSHRPLTLSSTAEIPSFFAPIPDGRQETEGGTNTAGHAIVIGAPHKRSGSSNHQPAVANRGLRKGHTLRQTSLEQLKTGG